MQAIINPSKEIPYPKLPNYYPSMLLEVNRTHFLSEISHSSFYKLFSIYLQMVQLCLKNNPKERASVADLLKFPIEMVIPINK